MLSLDPVRQNSGGVAAATSSTPVTVSFSGGDQTEAGNTLIVVLASGNGQGFSATPPAGWAHIGGAVHATDSSSRVFLRGPEQGLAAGETSWNFTPQNAPAGPVRWTVLEYEGIATNATLDTYVLDALSGSGIPDFFTSGTTAVAITTLTSAYDAIAFSIHYSYNPTGTDTWDSHTGGFIEIVEGSQAGSGSDNITLSVSGLPVQRIGTYGATATCSRTLNATNAGRTLSFVLAAAGARRAPSLTAMDGAEHGVITGNTLGPANYKILESATAGVSVSTTAKRSGTYGWLTTSSSAAANRTIGNSTQLLNQIVFRRAFRFPTLPAADTEFWVLTWTGAAVVFRFINASSKIGVKVGTGTEVVSDQVITANQWFAIDWYPVVEGGTQKVKWSVDYNAELTDTTAAVVQSDASGSTLSGILSTYRVGWTTALTATLHDDDGAAAGHRVYYPLGDIRIVPLKVDPVSTPTISGTATNFGVMTNNGTVAAWNAANARNAIDDIPPDLSGTRDAAVCLLAHASDYAEFDPEPYDMAVSGVYIRGVRYVVCMWAASATAATIRLNAYDGTTSHSVYPEADPGADSAATPVWVSRQILPASGRIDWDQAKLDALRLRMGSNDATPDIGIDAFVAELAVVKAQPEVLFGSPGDPVYVAARRDPDTNGLVGMDITTVGAGATVNYEVDSVAQTPVVVAADATVYEPILGGGEDFPTVNKIELIPG